MLTHKIYRTNPKRKEKKYLYNNNLPFQRKKKDIITKVFARNMLPPSHLLFRNSSHVFVPIPPSTTLDLPSFTYQHLIDVYSVTRNNSYIIWVFLSLYLEVFSIYF